MKNILKKTSTFLAAIILATSVSVFSAAAEDTYLNGLSFEPPISSEGNVQTYDWSVPYEEWNLGSSGAYSFSGSASTGKLYTNYYFTGVNILTVSAENNGSSLTTCYVYKKTKSGYYYAIGYFDIYAGNACSKAYNVDSQGEYFLMFTSPCTVSGTVA